jgi:hypothetical protein
VSLRFSPSVVRRDRLGLLFFKGLTFTAQDDTLIWCRHNPGAAKPQPNNYKAKPFRAKLFDFVFNRFAHNGFAFKKSLLFHVLEIQKSR